MIWCGSCAQASELFNAANQTASEAFAAIRTVAAFSMQVMLPVH